MDRLPLETWFYEVPIVTRCFVVGAILTSLAVQIDLVSPFQLFFSWSTAVTKQQYWRFLTTFLFFGELSVDFLFHLFFMSRYCRMLEESYARRTLDFAWLMGIAAAGLILLSPFARDPYLGSALSFTLTYLWSRRNPTVQLSMLGLFTFSAAWLPWVLIGFSLVIYGHLPVADLLGLAVGHVIYFLEDVWPLNATSGGARYLAPPRSLRRWAGYEQEERQVSAGVAPAPVAGVQEGHVHHD
ncbi:putative ER-associated proteolytic system protein Der1 [Protomyces lactucae-debilis]|uniref:Derlin n=1 Tax=Protomyces lactucae-debilis TaxID=2754530 RepID=A0A1Y2FNF4_PROLT|nr:putative ER-associated proteolytic system protein Der1 [Protomyces lactucae-debilis]ORY85540.1 putative ER-associated proteolytic system protein Der1 [Protomyces lactucae-debilis]